MVPLGSQTSDRPTSAPSLLSTTQKAKSRSPKACGPTSSFISKAKAKSGSPKARGTTSSLVHGVVLRKYASSPSLEPMHSAVGPLEQEHPKQTSKSRSPSRSKSRSPPSSPGHRTSQERNSVWKPIHCAPLASPSSKSTDSGSSGLCKHVSSPSLGQTYHADEHPFFQKSDGSAVAKQTSLPDGLVNSGHESPSTNQNGVDEKNISIVCNDAPGGKDGRRSFERKALNVQLLPSELEHVQQFRQKDSDTLSEALLQDDESTRSWVDYLAEFLGSNKFNATVGGLILLNTVLMALELDQDPIADYNAVATSFWQAPRVPQKVFDGVEVAFFIVFGLEMFLRFLVSRWALFKEFTTYIDLAALAPVVMVFLFDVQSTKQLTLLRVFRLLKLTRISRLIRLSRELSVLVRSIASSMRSLMWIGVLLLIVVYCSAITCTMLIGHDQSFSPDNENVILWEEAYNKQVSVKRYWGSTMRSMVTLFQIFTLDDWNGIARPIIETHSPELILFFITFIFLTTFGLLNLLMGTIVDHSVNAHKDAEQEKEKLLQDEHKQMLLITLRLFSIMDLDGNGKLSSAEMLQFFQEQSLEDVLREELDYFKVKIDYQELLDMCLSIADAWKGEQNNDDGITMEEFAGAAMRLRGTARSRDLLSVHVLTKSTIGRISACETQLEQHGQMMCNMNEKLAQILEVLTDSKAEPLSPECSDNGNGWRASRSSRAPASKKRRSSPKKVGDSSSRQQPPPDSARSFLAKAQSLSKSKDSFTSSDPPNLEQDTELDEPSSPTSNASALEKIKQLHEERMAAGIQSGMFGHEKVTSFVDQIMTTMPDFANTQSGVAIRSYTAKRRASRSGSLPPGLAISSSSLGQRAASPAPGVGQMQSNASRNGSRNPSRHGSRNPSWERRVRPDPDSPVLSPGWLGCKLLQSAPAITLPHISGRPRRWLSAPPDLIEPAPALPGLCAEREDGDWAQPACLR